MSSGYNCAISAFVGRKHLEFIIEFQLEDIVTHHRKRTIRNRSYVKLNNRIHRVSRHSFFKFVPGIFFCCNYNFVLDVFVLVRGKRANTGTRKAQRLALNNYDSMDKVPQKQKRLLLTAKNRKTSS